MFLSLLYSIRGKADAKLPFAGAVDGLTRWSRVSPGQAIGNGRESPRMAFAGSAACRVTGGMHHGQIPGMGSKGDLFHPAGHLENPPDKPSSGKILFSEAHAGADPFDPGI